MVENEGELGRLAASGDRDTDAPHEAAGASSPSGSVSTGAGPYWLFIADDGEHQIKGRHGKVLFRYPAEQGAMASAHLRQLQKRYGREGLPKEERIVLDVWGGPKSSEHVARYLPTVAQAWEIASAELAAGYLVNLRRTVEWGEEAVFDRRAGAA